MIERIKNLREYILDKRHHRYRRTPEELGLDGMAVRFAEENLAPVARSAAALGILLEHEEPVIPEGETIVLTRTVSRIPDLFTPDEWKNITHGHYIHEHGAVCNISPDYGHTIRHGLDARKREIEVRLQDASLTDDQKEFLTATADCIVALQRFVLRYADHAEATDRPEIATTLRRVATEGAGSFREALQLLRILHFALWESGNYHNTLGRFDQYMYPYFKRDIETGVLTRKEAFDLVEEFFLVCNKDSDLYPGMQQGDNGQSLVLGGRDMQGRYLFNDLSRMCLRASYELEMIDPKINIRVDRNTPAEIYELGSELTRIGLGFPQYSNDDVVIPGLVRKGYSPEDATDYVVAACWEFIIPGVAMDIPNIGALSLIDCVMDALPRLSECPDYETFYGLVEGAMASRLDDICTGHRNLYTIPAPMMSLLMDGTIERAQDISEGNRYNNYGIHGTGIATAADSLAAIRKFYFEERTVDFETWIGALEHNFNGSDQERELQRKLRTEAPKMGQDDDTADGIGAALLASFDRALDGRTNERGGIYRAGTGTAMYYIFHAADLGATPDGRGADEKIPANYSPSLFIRQTGPMSVIKSFTRPDLTLTVNGGPLTLEFDQSVFRNEESVAKLGMLVRTFITLGGHQIQLNTVCREKLLDAKLHPENYRNLIVRVWGWSGYFVELDECYQDHVINRIEFGL
jgi:formate C-acetyltransferase